MKTGRPHTKGLKSEYIINPCGEIQLGEYQRCKLSYRIDNPNPRPRPQNKGLRSGRDILVGHIHNRASTSNGEPGIYIGTLTPYIIRYNESRS